MTDGPIFKGSWRLLDLVPFAGRNLGPTSPKLSRARRSRARPSATALSPRRCSDAKAADIATSRRAPHSTRSRESSLYYIPWKPSRGKIDDKHLSKPCALPVVPGLPRNQGNTEVTSCAVWLSTGIYEQLWPSGFSCKCGGTTRVVAPPETRESPLDGVSLWEALFCCLKSLVISISGRKHAFCCILCNFPARWAEL